MRSGRGEQENRKIAGMQRWQGCRTSSDDAPAVPPASPRAVTCDGGITAGKRRNPAWLCSPRSFVHAGEASALCVQGRDAGAAGCTPELSG